MAIPPVRAQGDSGHIQDHNDIGTELAARLPLSGGTLTGAVNGTSATFSGTVTAATPTSNGHLTTKSYVDTALGNIQSGAFATATVRATYYNPLGVTSITQSSNVGAFSVTFPEGRFTQPPVVQCQAVQILTENGNSSVYAQFVTSETTTSQTFLYVINAGPGSSISPALTIAVADVLAVQMTSGSSYG